MLGGELDWHGIEMVGDLLGIVDFESFVEELAVIRDWMRSQDA